MKTPKSVFVEGPVSSAFIGDSIQKHQVKTNIGAHSIFLGQVRADQVGDEQVTGIMYTTFEELANQKMHEIREAAFEKYGLTCLHIYHSLGLVKSGEISLFVFTSAPHRKAAIDACEEIVERIKKDVPVWGQELLSNEGTRWKSNEMKA